MYFEDRIDAGEQLAEALLPYAQDNPVVFGLPRGGVVLAAVIADKLGAPLDLIIPRKVGHPGNPEYAICVITEKGHCVCNEDVKIVDQKWLGRALTQAQGEAKERRRRYTGATQPINVSGRPAIVVDDGMATGLTMRAALEEVKNQQPSQVIVAVPVMPTDAVPMLESLSTRIVALRMEEEYMGAVSMYYRDFSEVDDKAVIDILHARERV